MNVRKSQRMSKTLRMNILFMIELFLKVNIEPKWKTFPCNQAFDERNLG